MWGYCVWFKAALDRLAKSLAAIQMKLPQLATSWEQTIGELIARNGAGEQTIYVQISRGVAPRNHAIVRDISPTVLLFSMSADLVATQSVSAITMSDPRWDRCDIKATSLLANVLLRTHASDAQAYETILFRDDILTEGAASNVFIVVDGKIMTPKADHRILAGITRQFLIDALFESNLEVSAQDISKELFSEITEMWLTSSTRDLLPVTNCDNQAVGKGEVGPIFAEAKRRFDEFKQAFLSDESAKSITV